MDLLPGRGSVNFEAVGILDTMPFGSIDGPLPSLNPSFGSFQHLVLSPFFAGKHHLSFSLYDADLTKSTSRNANCAMLFQLVVPAAVEVLGVICGRFIH